MKQIIYITLLSSLLTTSSCSSGEKEYDATGTFETTEVVVSAKATGQLEQFQLLEGQQITAGAQIGQIDSEQLHLTLAGGGKSPTVGTVTRGNRQPSP